MTTVILQQCSFTFVSLRTAMPVYVTGVERTWDYLKEAFKRKSNGLPESFTKYYETVGHGPFLFAVSEGTVYYHNEEQWIPYRSATGIEHNSITIDV